MAKKILVITGASGNQGGSTAHTVLDSPELSSMYTIRAISRNISTPSMLALQSKGAELIQADLDDPSSLGPVLKGAHFAFLVTTTHYTGNSREIETRQARAFCEEAMKQGLEYLIWSSMSHPAKISGGKYANIEYFDDKAEIESYIRGLPFKSAFYAPASFMQNFWTHVKPRASHTGDGTFAITSIVNPDTKIPYIDITDTGKFVDAILARPEEYEGKFFAAADRLYTMTEMAGMIGKYTGKEVRYQQVPDEVFKGFLPEGSKVPVYEMWAFFRDFGYYGEGMEEMVKWAREQCLGETTGFEEWLGKVGYTVE